MDYKLVFDLQTSAVRFSNYLFILPGLVIFLVGVVTYIFRDHFSNPFRKKPMPQRFPFFLLLFGALWMQLSGLSLYAQYETAEHAIRTGKAATVTGQVVRFKPMPYLGHGMESFCISDTDACFSYSDYVVTPGFNQTSTHGGPIQQGLPVRVTYDGNTILKLEVSTTPAAFVRRNDDAPPPESALSPAR